MSQLAALTSRWAWRTPKRTAERLRSFAFAEHNTWLELTQAAEATPSPRRAAAYLRHAADEARHTQMFVARSRGVAPSDSLPFVRADSAALFSALGERDFLAFVAAGEARAHQQFTSYKHYFQRSDDKKTAGLFEAILADEARHAQYSAAFLLEVSDGESDARSARRRMAVREVGMIWMRIGRRMTHSLYALLMLLMYPLLWPLAAWTRHVRPPTHGFRR